MKRLFAMLAFVPVLWAPSEVRSAGVQQGSVADFTFEAIDGAPLPLAAFAGKVLLVVNTASYCGFTPQYKSLEALHAKYAGRGLVVLGFPSNDFGAQEPGAAGEIAALCENTFGVRFPMFAKSRVAADAGALRNPLFAELARRSGQSPRWNFHKYLVARDGESVSSFSSETDPLDAKLVQSVEKLLDAK